MKSRSICFSDEEVNAVLDGRMSMFARPINPQLYEIPKSLGGGHGWADKGVVRDDRIDYRLEPEWLRKYCPHGVVGDRLWVKEKFLSDAPRDGDWSDYEFYGCKNSSLSMIPNKYRSSEHCIYKSGWAGSDLVWRSPSQMPLWASRITLEILNVKVKRVSGVDFNECSSIGCNRHWNDLVVGERFHFIDSWNKRFKKYPYESNPWIWVVEFKRVK